jgi:DNA-3-methyladenine glycosylase
VSATRPGTTRLRKLLEAGALDAAPALIGCSLVRTIMTGRGRSRRTQTLSGVIVETEAYPGGPDRGSHTFDGRRTERNESMYARAGVAYVYFTYGMHHCLNVVTGGADDGQAVLIRAIGPSEGIATMRRHRAEASGRPEDAIRDRDVASGPAKLCQALRVDRSLNGADMLGPASHLRLVFGVRSGSLQATPRIGLGRSTGDWAAKPWRWVLGP